MLAAAGYIKPHLRIAGAEATIFSDGFIAGAHQYTKGIARKINTPCLNALLIGCAQQQRVLDETTSRRWWACTGSPSACAPASACG